MKNEYDFEGAERGRFFKEGARLVPPVHLEPDVQEFLVARAAVQGLSLSALVNSMLKKDIEHIEATE